MELSSQIRTSHLQPSQTLTRLDRLIAELRRSLQLLETDLKIEERGARVLDISDPIYPIAARALRLRRDNLAGTIATLEAKWHGMKDAVVHAEPVV